MHSKDTNIDKYLISLVIAAKDPPAAPLALCLASFAALRYAGCIQLVLVESGVPAQLDNGCLNSFADVKRLLVPAEGVYSAYNTGIGAAEGTYLLFFGIDDIALPGIDNVIAHLDASIETYYLYAAACYMQASGLRCPSNRRISLIFGNWCHQGIFYLRRHLLSNRYEIRYKMQADHKMNIDIVSNHEFRFGISQELVAYFSAGGISSVTPDLLFRKDFPLIVASAYGWPWGGLTWAKQKIVDLLLGVPEKRFIPRNRQ